MQAYSLPHILFILTSTIAYIEASSATRGRIPSSGFGTPGVDASYDYVGKKSPPFTQKTQFNRK